LLGYVPKYCFWGYLAVITNQRFLNKNALSTIMELKTEDQLAEQGMAAIKQFELSRLNDSLDQVVNDNLQKLNFKVTAKRFKSFVLQAAEIVYSGDETILKYANEHKLDAVVIDLLVGAFDYVEEEQAGKSSAVALGITSEDLMKMYEKGKMLGEKGVVSSVFDIAIDKGLKEFTDLITKNDKESPETEFYVNMAVQTAKYAAKRLKADVLKQLRLATTDNLTSNYRKFAVALAKRSETRGVDPIQLLDNPKYSREIQDLIATAYGSVDAFCSARYGVFPMVVTSSGYIRKTFNHENVKPRFLKTIISTVSSFDHLQDIFNDQFKQKIGPNSVKKLEDYMLLAEEFGNSQISECKKDHELYSTRFSL